MFGTHLTAAALCLAAIAAPGCGGDTDKPSATARRATAPVAAAKETVGVDAPGVIVYRRYTNDSHSTGELWAINPDGTGRHKLFGRANHVYDQPAISPDGKNVAFQECPEGKPCHTFLIGIDGTDVHELPLTCELEHICDISGPSWSPDGQLAVNRSSGSVKHSRKGDTIERSEIVVVGPEGGRGRTVVRSARFGGDLLRPVWSPDGRKIAYEWWPSVSLGPNEVALRVVSADGGRPRQITPFTLGAGDAADWSPDGKWIAFRTHAETDTSASDIEVVHPDGSGRRNLTHYGSSGNTALSTSFSPDGQWIVFAAQRDGGPADIFVMRSDGADLRPLTRTPQWDSAPDWGRAAAG
jgi:Tol biopolymer transport system component